MRFMKRSLTIIIVILCSPSVLFSQSLTSSTPSHNITSTSCLDSRLEGLALGALTRRRGARTGALYAADLPADLMGIEVLVVRLRGRSLWANGVNLTHIQIPPRTVLVPHVKRLAIVYQDLGNWSRHYYSVPGYRLLTSVVGFQVLDLSEMKIVMNRRITKVNVTKKIHFETVKPIAIKFQELETHQDEETVSRARCVTFTGREFHISHMRFWGVCMASTQGHFSVIAPKIVKKEKKFRILYLWVIGFVVGFAGLAGLVGYLGLVVVRILKTKRIQVMERQADEGVVFNDRWVGSTKMPSASVTRTQPALENFEFL